MADEAYRAAERRARESGEVADAARLLLERVRRGELQPGALSLAAYLGDPAAGAARGVRLEVDEADEVATTRWARGLVAWGWPVFGRGLFAGCFAVLEAEAWESADQRARALAPYEDFWRAPTAEGRQRFIPRSEGIPFRSPMKAAWLAAHEMLNGGPSQRSLPPLYIGIPMAPSRLRPRLALWALSTPEEIRGPTGATSSGRRFTPGPHEPGSSSRIAFALRSDARCCCLERRHGPFGSCLDPSTTRAFAATTWRTEGPATFAWCP